VGEVVKALRESCGETRSSPGRQGSSERLLAQLYRAHHACLHSYLTGILKSEADADDVAQEAFLRLHRCADLSIYGNPRAVLFKTAYRLALNCLRGRRSNPLDRAQAVLDEVIGAPEPETSVEEALIAREQETAYGRALECLPARCRQVIELRTIQELSYKEMSDTLGLSVSTLEKHIVKGKRIAAEALAGWWSAEAFTPSAVAA
jgi:RNA polymerase sigma-70 factor (ECF subfamily)